MKIHYVIGDSHSEMFNKYTLRANSYTNEKLQTQFVTFHSGAHTAYSIIKANRFIRDFLQKIPPKEQIWFVYGEIDARFRIFDSHVKSKKPLDAVIEDVVANYLAYIRALRAEGYNIGVVSILPPNRLQPPGKINHELFGYVTVGTDIERKYITNVLNAKLQLACANNQIPFLDIYYILVDPTDGMNKVDWLIDTTHYHYVGDLIIEKVLKCP